MKQFNNTAILNTKKSKLAYLLAALIAVGIILGLISYLLPKEATAAWVNDSWKFRKKLVIDASQVSDTGSADYSNFPVLVSIDNDASLMNSAQTDGDDILFTSSDGTTQLDHEIESYDSTKGTLRAWVEIPTLDYNNDTTIYIYYGNSSASSQQDATGTWDEGGNNNFKGVWHLKETPSGGAPQMQDSTTNNNDLTATTLVAGDQVTGKVNGSLNFDGTSTDSLAITDASQTGLDISGNITISLWYKPATVSILHSLLWKGTQSSTRQYNLYINSDNKIRFNWHDGTALRSGYTDAAQITSANGWYYITITAATGGYPQAYVNGSAVAMWASNNQFDGIRDGTEDLTMGYSALMQEYLNGILDEVKISGTNRTAGWIATEYNNQNSPSTFFKSVGKEEKSKEPVLYLKFDEGTGTVANDSSAQRNNGTLSGTTKPAWQAEDLCVFGKCLYFEGSTAYVGVGSTSPNVNTVSFWVKPKTNGESMVDLDGGTHNVAASGGVISANGFDSPLIYVNGKRSTTLTANSWQYVEVTTATAFSSASMKVGTNGSTYLNGFIDEFKVYDYARSAQEILADYNSRSSRIGTSAQIGSSDQWLSNGLVGYWKMDETSGTSVADSSGNGNTGTLTSAQETNGENDFSSSTTTTIVDTTGTSPLSSTDDIYNGMYLAFSNRSGVTCNVNSQKLPITDYVGSTKTITTLAFAVAPEINECIYTIQRQVGGKFGSGLQFDGVANLVTVSNTISSVQTIVFWINPTSVTSGGLIDLDGTNYLTVANGTITANNFTPTIYVNGVVSSTLSTGSWQHVVITNASGISSSAINFAKANNTFLKGSLDDIRFYNRALTPSEIQSLYEWAPGPVGYWQFEEKKGTSAFDSSGNGYTGTLLPAGLLPQWIRGKYDSGLDFYGTGAVTDTDEVYVGNKTLLANTVNITLEAWINTPSVSFAQNTVICQNPLYSNNACLYRLVVANDEVLFSVYQTPTALDSTTTTAANLTTNQWYHIAATFDDAANTVKIYVNGVLQITDTSFTVSFMPSSLNFRIGNDTNRNYVGKIDEVKVYNYVRTPKQIVEDMNAGHPAVGSPVGSAVAHYKFDEGAGTTANDTGPNNNDLTLSSASWTKSGKFNMAYTGASNTRLTRADDADFDFAAADDLTLSVWFKRDTISNQEYLVYKENGNEGYALSLDSDGDLVFGIGDTGSTSFPEETLSTDSKNYDDNSWHHAVAIKQGTTALRLYVDGKEVVSDTSVAVDATLENAGKLIVGDANETDGTDEFLGTIDELKIYRFALTEDEVKTELNRGKSIQMGATGDNPNYAINSASQKYCVPGDSATCSGPVGEWKFDERSGQTANDTSGNGNNGTLGANSTPSTDDPTWSNGKYGGGLQFDGSNDRVDIPDSSNLTIAGPVTVEAWVNPITSDNGGNDAIITKGPGVPNYNYLLYFSANNTPKFFIDGLSTISVTATSAISKNSWSHLTGVYDGSNLKIYINGILSNSTQSSGTPSTTANGYGVGIGARAVDGWAPWNGGKIDDVKIYNYARTPSQIAWDVNLGEPVLRYKMDECTGTTIHDAVSGNNGTWSGTGSGSQTSAGDCNTSASTAWYNGRVGKRNKSLNFDGTDDYVSTSSFSPLATAAQTTTNFSWGGWFYPATSGVASKTLLNKTNEFKLSTDSNSKPICDLRYGGATWTTNTAGSGSTALATSGWNHILCTYDGTNIKVYLNGKQTDSWSQTNTVTAASSAFYVGSSSTPDQYFSGQIDEVKIWNYALSGTQVKNEVNQGAVNFGPLTGSP